VPRGYEPAWTDDRLNPRRSEMTLKPSQIAPRVVVPRGYRAAWEDDRLNTRRAPQGSAGEAAMDTLWTREVPRQLGPSLGRDSGIRHSDPAVRGHSPFWQPPAASAGAVTRLSSRSAPLPAAQSFIKVATYQSEADAKQTARALAQRGLPMRMGRLKRGGETYPLVLSGPFASASDAQSALSQLKTAGFPQAVLLR
jgi:hypothetical protein